jgi:glycosyltransferase involved in cell wall biosynthesis
MNIVYCVFQCNKISGGLRVIVEHANILQKRGHNVQIWTIMPAGDYLPFETTVPIVQVPCDYDDENHKVLRLYPERINAKIPDVYIAGSHPTAFGCLSLPGTKAFWYLQHDESVTFIDLEKPEPAKASFREALKLPITRISNSQWTKKQLEDKYGADSVLLPCGIDTELFAPATPLLVDDGQPTILASYNELTWKGMADLAEALNKVFDVYPKSNLVFFSAVPQPHLVTNRPVTYFFNPPQTKLKNIYCSASVFVSSSWEEGFGLPGLEALACGTPLVTTDSGGVLEYAKHRHNALIVPPRDPSALADAIIEIIESHALQSKLRKNGIVEAKKFKWNKVIDELETILLN